MNKRDIENFIKQIHNAADFPNTVIVSVNNSLSPVDRSSRLKIYIYWINVVVKQQFGSKALTNN